MSSNDIVGSLLRALEIVSAWPVILLFLLLLFWRPIGRFINRYAPQLVSRLTKVQAGGYTMEFAALRRLRATPGQADEGRSPQPFDRSLSEEVPPTTKATPELFDFGGTPAERAKERDYLHEQFRGVFIVHKLAPTTSEEQEYEIFIYLKRRLDAPLMGNAQPELNVEEAEFFFGSHWNDQIFKGNRVEIYRGDRVEDVIGVKTAAYRPFLCTCHVKFQDGHWASLYRRIDFEMGDVVTAALEAQSGA
jgi:hypothetical protein